MDCCMIYANVSTAVGGGKKKKKTGTTLPLSLIITHATHTHTRTDTQKLWILNCKDGQRAASLFPWQEWRLYKF